MLYRDNLQHCHLAGWRSGNILRYIFRKCLVQISVFTASIPQRIIRDIYQSLYVNVDRDSVVGIATRYELDGSRIKSWWAGNFLHPSRPSLGFSQLPVQWVPGLFPGIKRAVRGAEHPPKSSVEVKESVKLSLWAFMSCYRVRFSVTFTLCEFSIMTHRFLPYTFHFLFHLLFYHQRYIG